MELAESLSHIKKKLDNFDDNTKKLSEVIKESNFENNQEIVPVEFETKDENIQTNLGALPNSSISSELMTKTLGFLISSLNSLRTKPSTSGPTILGVPIYTLCCDRMQIQDNVNDLTPEIYKALSFA